VQFSGRHFAGARPFEQIGGLRVGNQFLPFQQIDYGAQGSAITARGRLLPRVHGGKSQGAKKYQGTTGQTCAPALHNPSKIMCSWDFSSFAMFKA